MVNFNSNYFRKIYHNLSKVEAEYYEFKEDPQTYVYNAKYRKQDQDLFLSVFLDEDKNFKANPLAVEKLERNLDFYAEMEENWTEHSNAAIIKQLNWLDIPYEKRIFGLTPDEIALLFFVYSYLTQLRTG